MTSTLWTRWNRKKISLGLGGVMFACVAAFLSVGLAPKPAPSVSLGAEWQCSRTFLMTTCTKALQTKAAVQGSQGEPVCLKRRT